MGSRSRASLRARWRFAAHLPRSSSTRFSPPTSWAADLRAGIEAGAANYGVSPGFSLPPPDVVPGAETLTPEPGNPGVMVRTLNAVVLHEVSFVSRATYQGTEISLRHEDLRDDEAAAELVALQERRRLLYGLL